ncbi:MAG: DUF5049 domain-containing protein [Lachnospiraceae bacterium]|nr:DUF5049 domain-containing protein [Lachnospiraceae bacterium]
MTDELKEQILAVRDTGRTNMFMISGVQMIAYEMDLFELALFLDDPGNRKAYLEFILNGKR